MNVPRALNIENISPKTLANSNKWTALVTVVFLAITLIIYAIGMWAQKRKDDGNDDGAYEGFLKFKDAMVIIGIILASVAGIWTLITANKIKQGLIST